MDAARDDSTERPYLELDVFAGAPNPRWELPDADMGAIVARLTALPLRVRARAYLEPVSWYGGIVVGLPDPQGRWRRFTVFNEHVFEDVDDTVRWDEGRRLERELYATITPTQWGRVGNQSFEVLSQPLNEVWPVNGAGSEPKPSCRGALGYPPPSQWNRNTRPGRHENKCYNYANDVFFTVIPALPGGALRVNWTMQSMHDLVVSDGLVPANPGNNRVLPAMCHAQPAAHLLAVCLRAKEAAPVLEAGVAVDSYADFHCFRLDAGGGWSHKDGSKKTTNTDDKGAALLRLDLAKFKLEQDLVGYYWTYPGTHRQIRTP